MKEARTPAESRRIYAVVTSVVTLAIGIGLGVAGSHLIKSPEEAALDNAPPMLPPATAAVEEGTLGESIVVDAVFASSTDQQIPSTDLDGVVTYVPFLGEGVASGTVVLEVSTRPIFVVSGDAIVSRDFVGGTEGPDVAALQSGLEALNYEVGQVDGIYGPQTAAAVEALYRDAGYELPDAAASPAEVAVANAEVISALATLRDLEAAEAPPADIAVAAAGLVLARESLARIRNASLTPFPAAELVLVGGESFDVVASGATVGLPATQGLIILASESSQTLWASVPRNVASQVSVGTVVSVSSELDEVGEDTHAGSVSWMASTIGLDGVRERFGDSFSLAPDQVGLEITLVRPLSRTDAGRLRATIETGASKEPTLIVPLSAIRTSADGRTTVAVLVEGADEGLAFKSIEVTVIDTFSGRASVESPDLRVGDNVAIP